VFPEARQFMLKATTGIFNALTGAWCVLRCRGTHQCLHTSGRAWAASAGVSCAMTMPQQACTRVPAILRLC
jgi:hypothetical protein